MTVKQAISLIEERLPSVTSIDQIGNVLHVEAPGLSFSLSVGNRQILASSTPSLEATEILLAALLSSDTARFEPWKGSLDA